jgi:RNA-splicing ligase RtcB
MDNSLQQDDAVLLVHSGSQGLGGNILKKYTTETHTSFEEGSADAIGYMEEHNQVCECAKANRDLIALRFRACLEPGNEDWTLGSSDASSCQNCTEEMQDDRHLAQQR